MKTKSYQEKVEDIIEALRAGQKFYVDTYIGKLQIVSLHPKGDWAYTGQYFRSRSWMICSTEINRWHLEIK